jgi:hypothetical protein
MTSFVRVTGRTPSLLTLPLWDSRLLNGSFTTLFVEERREKSWRFGLASPSAAKLATRYKSVIKSILGMKLRRNVSTFRSDQSLMKLSVYTRAMQSLRRAYKYPFPLTRAAGTVPAGAQSRIHGTSCRTHEEGWVTLFRESCRPNVSASFCEVQLDDGIIHSHGMRSSPQAGEADRALRFRGQQSRPTRSRYHGTSLTMAHKL